MKKWTLALLGATTAFALSSGAAKADTTATIYDALNVPGTGAYSHGAGGGGTGGSIWGDNYNGTGGTNFFSGNILVTWKDNGDVVLRLHTNMPNAGADRYGFADIFIDLASDGALASGNATDWDIGIDINSGYGTNGFGGTDANNDGRVDQGPALTGNGLKAALVAAPTVLFAGGSSINSTKICTDGSCGNAADGRRPEVEVAGETYANTFDITQASDGDAVDPKYYTTITLEGVNTTGLWNEFRLFWGTGWCANDTVEGVAKIPVPAALPIIGAALAGFGFAGWRQRKAA